MPILEKKIHKLWSQLSLKKTEEKSKLNESKEKKGNNKLKAEITERQDKNREKSKWNKKHVF